MHCRGGRLATPPWAAARPDAPGDGERPAREALQAVRAAAEELVEAQALDLGLEHASALVKDIAGNKRQQGLEAVLRIAGAAAGAAARGGLTRFAISPPFARFTAAMSYWLCKPSQNCALLPK